MFGGLSGGFAAAAMADVQVEQSAPAADAPAASPVDAQDATLR